MSYTRERDRCIAELLPVLGEQTTYRVLRLASTLARLAVAQCNGDWPADHGTAWKTAECPFCRSAWAVSALKRNGCPDCRAEAALRAALAGTPFRAVTQGDPRGYVVRLVPVNTPFEDVDCGRVRGIGIPTRR